MQAMGDHMAQGTNPVGTMHEANDHKRKKIYLDMDHELNMLSLNHQTLDEEPQDIKHGINYNFQNIMLQLIDYRLFGFHIKKLLLPRIVFN